MLTKKKNCLAWVRVRRGACEVGMPEHGGPQAAAFARACKSSPPPPLFNLLSFHAHAHAEGDTRSRERNRNTHT